MKNLKISILSVLILTGILSSKAQNSFTLEEAINHALKNNRTAVNAQEGIDAAYKQKWETTADGLPQINAAASYNYWLKQQLSLIPGEFAGLPQGEFLKVAFGTPQTFSGSISVSQKLFDGSYLVALQSAKVFLEISKNQKDKTDVSVKEQVINAYGNVLMAQESVEITEHNIATLQKNLYETQQMFENGLVEEESAEQLQITLGTLKNNLNNLKRLKVIGKKMLNITMGRDLHASIELTDNLVNLSESNINLKLATDDYGISNNIDYKIAQNDLKSKVLLLKLEKSKALPTFNVMFQSAVAGNGTNLETTLRTPDLIPSNLLAFNLNVPIFSSFRRTAATQRKQIELKQAERNLTDVEQKLSLQLAQAQSEYQLAIENLRTTKENLKLAERIEAKNQTKFNEGISSSFDLRQAQTQLYSTQQEYIQSMQNVINKKATLETIINN